MGREAEGQGLQEGSSLPTPLRVNWQSRMMGKEEVRGSGAHVQGVPRSRRPLLTGSHSRRLPETLLHHHSLTGGMDSRLVTWGFEKSNGKPS